VKSGLYAGTVFHGRLRPRRHRLRYGIFMLALDLDEIEGLAAQLKLLAHNAWGLVSLHDRDFAGRIRAPLRPQIEALLAAAGYDLAGGRITLLCMPRLLGHGFNPLSVYFCHDQDDRLVATVQAVRNTFGQRHDYVLPALTSADGRVRQACRKAFHVSPFMPMDLDYQFDLLPPAERVAVGITVHDEAGLLLVASFAGERQDLTDGALWRAVVSHPWQLVGVLAAIHWEAVKLVLKGFRLFPGPKPGEGATRRSPSGPPGHLPQRGRI